MLQRSNYHALVHISQDRNGNIGANLTSVLRLLKDVNDLAHKHLAQLVKDGTLFFPILHMLVRILC